MREEGRKKEWSGEGEMNDHVGSSQSALVASHEKRQRGGKELDRGGWGVEGLEMWLSKQYTLCEEIVGWIM